MQVIGTGNKSRSWFPGTYVPITSLAGLEVHSAPIERVVEVTEQVDGAPRRRRVVVRRRVEVQVSRGTLHGTPAELIRFARLVMRAAVEADPSLIERPADRQDSPLRAA